MASSKSEEFRILAAQLRKAAETANSPITRETLLRLAEEFDHLAMNPPETQPRQMIKIRHSPRRKHLL